MTRLTVGLEIWVCLRISSAVLICFVGVNPQPCAVTGHLQAVSTQFLVCKMAVTAFLPQGPSGGDPARGRLREGRGGVPAPGAGRPSPAWDTPELQEAAGWWTLALAPSPCHKETDHSEEACTTSHLEWLKFFKWKRSVSEDVEKVEHVHCWWDCKMCGCCGKLWRFLERDYGMRHFYS